MNITWRKAITAAMRLHGETWDDVVAEAPPVSGWDRVFYNGYGGIEGEHFTLWTHNRVYFLYVTMVQSGQTLFLVTLVQRGLLM